MVLYQLSNTNNEKGQLGTGEDGQQRAFSVDPVSVQNLDGQNIAISQIAAGDGYSVALRQDGQMIYVWGNPQMLGNGPNSQTSAPLPTQVKMTGALAGKTVSDIAASTNTVLALTTDGMIYTWGNNAHFQVCEQFTANSLFSLEQETLLIKF